MLGHPGAYLHFPWCVKKCPYCDFNSHPLRGDDAQAQFAAYTDALTRDIAAQLEDDEAVFASVFLGGGTPSLFAPGYIGRALAALPLEAGAEVTMEANPGTTEFADFADYLAAGVNRVSLGAQSFDDGMLARLGRIHSAAETHRAFALAREGGVANINLDLMWGLPEQTVAQAVADLEAAIALAPEHLSWYQLTIEAKTEFARRTPILPVEDRLAEMEAEGLALLADAGYERYEISAFARGSQGQDDWRCRHNLNYWRFGDYLGAGAGAHGKRTSRESRVQVSRTTKPSQPRLYLLDSLPTDTTPVEKSALPLEFMMNALRLVGGVDIEVFAARTGGRWADVESTWQALAERKLVEPDRCATTPLGLRYLDTVLAAFV